MIADNQIALKSEWDIERLSFELKDLQSVQFDLTPIGFDDDELEKLLATDEKETSGGGGLTDPDDIPEAPKEPKTKLGDLYILGNHRLLCGDSTNAEHVARLMAGEKVDMVFTDPPYELKTKGGGLLKESAAMKGIRQLGIDKFDPSILVRHAETMVFCCNKPLIPAYIKLAENWSVAWDLCVYHKLNVTPNYGGHLMTDLEYLLVIGKQAPIPKQEKELYSKLFSGGKDPDNSVAWSKPVALCEKFLRLFSSSRGVVLDIFGGSGSTLIACEKTNRKCFMMELDPTYCDVILERWSKFTGRDPVLVESQK